jgi:hypothetical protein
MKTFPVAVPLPSEKLLSVLPVPAPFVADPLRLSRPNLFPGRHLSADTLERGMDSVLTPLAARGAAVQEGLLSGLEVTSADPSQLTIAQGRGLCADGSTLGLPQDITVSLADLPVLLSPDAPTLSLAKALADANPGLTVALVLRPGFVRVPGEPLGNLPLPGSPSFTAQVPADEDQAFRIDSDNDAVQLVLIPLRDAAANPGPAWRNRAAHRIFELESLDPTLLPWDGEGLPIALLGLKSDQTLAWIDRHSVARQGGRPRRRTLQEGSIRPVIAEARFLQFLEQLSQGPAQISEFLRLPPVGVLPKTLLGLYRNDPQIPTGTQPQQYAAYYNQPALWQYSQAFLGPQFQVSLSVAPLGQLDALLRKTRGLAPYDVLEGGTLSLVLPVADQWFDPRLLILEFPDASFYQTISAILAAVNSTLGRRFDLRRRQNLLELICTGRATLFPDDDPSLKDAQENMVTSFTDSAIPSATSFGVTRAGTALNAATYTASLLDDYRQFLQTRCAPFWTLDFSPFVTDTAGTAQAKFIASITANGGDPVDASLVGSFIAAQAKTSAPEQAFLAALPSLQASTAATVATSLDKFLSGLEAKVDTADRLLDAGFLKVNTDVFRVGHLLNGSSLDTKFSVSPSLTQLLQRPATRSTPEMISQFTSRLAANMAPSTISKQAATTTSSAPLPPTGLAVLRAGISMPINRFAFDPNAVDVTPDITRIVTNNNSIANNIAVLNSATNLTPAQQQAFTALKGNVDDLTKTVQDLNSSGKLQAVGAVAKFANNYVEGFTDLTPKQVRAIPLDRLAPPLAPQVHNDLHNGRQEILTRLSQLNLPLGGLETEFIDFPRGQTQQKTRLFFHDLLTRMAPNKDITGTDDADEARYFTSGVRYADISISAMRAVERRIADYREVIAEGRKVLDSLRRCLDGAKAEGQRADSELGQLRHELATARALLAEEQTRLNAINDQRRSVLAEHVDFVVFHRPLGFRPVETAPVRSVNGAVVDNPIPDCLKENLPLPSELAGLREVLRGAPADWLRNHRLWLAGIDRIQVLRSYLIRATASPQAPVQDETLLPGDGRYGNGLRRLFRSNADRFAASLTPLPSRIDERLSWSELQNIAVSGLTVGHLLGYAPTEISRLASDQVDQLFRVAACLHRDFGEVEPVTRLAWADLYSEYDGPVNLRDLGTLTGWSSVDYSLRHTMQSEVDWLFDQVNPQVPAATGFINDLVRVCLLLASHSPVDRLVSAEIMEAFRPVPGSLIRLRLDPSLVRVGMEALTNASQGAFVRAVVQDIGTDHVVARVLPGSDPNLLIREKTRLRLVNPALS